MLILLKKSKLLFDLEMRYSILFRNKTDMGPLCSHCSCYTCKTFKRAYLHHLIACKEMLGFTLLIIHNMTEFDRMFEMIRTHLAQK